MSTIVSFGELMMRLKTPGFLRFPQCTSLEATFGGGEEGEDSFHIMNLR